MNSASAQLAQCFNACFFSTHRVLCLGGAAEPSYTPARSAHGIAILRYARDHAASVLHEAAHWCLAPQAARAQTDYGLCYAPPPRDAVNRAAFFAAELPVQTLERWFAQAANRAFEVSVDDLSCPPDQRRAFAQRVDQAFADLRACALPAEARTFAAALRRTGSAR